MFLAELRFEYKLMIFPLFFTLVRILTEDTSCLDIISEGRVWQSDRGLNPGPPAERSDTLPLDYQWPPSEPIERGILMGDELSGELVINGLENMDCGAVQALERVGGAFIAFLFSNVGIIGLVVGYTITGAFIFIFIEKKEVSEGNIIVMKLRNETVDFLWNLTYVLNVFDEPHWKTAVSLKLMDYQEEVVKAISKGFDGSDNNLGSSQWSFSGAFLYSLTVITTIGLICDNGISLMPH
uniref:Uncharacterized protein n=1 Tax=Timema cristinae TaxID=61476 RepID=A0A7R9CD65_TIMCR|nr:unnamed protein product [Timema cristinae]